MAVWLDDASTTREERRTLAIIQRRTFYGKVGAGGPLIDLMKEMGGIMGPGVKSRVLSDYQSGRTDRVVYEIEVPDLAALSVVEQGMGQNPEAIGAWFQKLTGLIDQAEVEMWQTH